VAHRLSTAQAVRAARRPVFTTREIAALRGSSLSGASQSLRRFEKQGLLAQPARGVWCDPSDPRFTRFSLVPFLAGGHRAYVSLLSALHLYGMIEQIPQVVYAVTTGHTRTVETGLGAFSFHRIQPALFAGFDWHGPGRDFLIATPEKALVDSLYLSSRKGRRFRFFPEIDLGTRFRLREARRWIRRIRDPRIRRHAADRLEALRAPGRSGR
jgi:predicted transcriptional regulator of viral defense system